MDVVEHPCSMCGGATYIDASGYRRCCAMHGVEPPRETGEDRLRRQYAGAVEALRRIAAGHAFPSKLAGEALDALPPDDNVYDPPYDMRGR